MRLRLARLFPLLSTLSALACAGGDLVLPSDGGPAQVVVVQGDQQQAAAGEGLADSLVVQVVDTAGQGLAERTVSWSVSTGGGQVSPQTSTTDTDGLAWTRWTLGPEAGDNEVRAGVSGAGFVTFTAVGTGGGSGGGGGGDEEPSASRVDHFVFRLQPHDVDVGERFRVEVALVDRDGNVVDLSGILIYLGLFEDGGESPVNYRLSGNRFRSTDHGVAVFDDLAINHEGRYRIRALSDQLPELGPHGPEPFLFSLSFDVD
jgi:hypothetical protein